MSKHKIKVNTKPVSDNFSGPNERIVEYSCKSGGGLISFWEKNGRLRIDLYRHDATVDIMVSTNPTGSKPKPNVFRMLDASLAHLTPLTALDQIPGVTASERELGWLLLVPEHVEEHIAECDGPDGGDDVLPPDIIDLWRCAEQHNCQYVLLDRDGPVLPELPTYRRD